MSVSPVLGRKRQADPWGSPGSQSNLPGEFRVPVRHPSQAKHGGWFLGSDPGEADLCPPQPYRHTGTHEHKISVWLEYGCKMIRKETGERGEGREQALRDRSWGWTAERLSSGNIPQKGLAETHGVIRGSRCHHCAGSHPA